MSEELVFADKVVLVTAVQVVPLVVVQVEQMYAMLDVQVVVWHLDTK